MTDTRPFPEAIAAERAVAGIILLGLGGEPSVNPDDCLDPLVANVVRHGAHLPRPCPITVATAIGDCSDRVLIELRALMVGDYAVSNLPAYAVLIATAAHRRRVIAATAHLTDAAFADKDLLGPLAQLISEVKRPDPTPRHSEERNQ